jgi:hypothetical protein
MVATIYLTLKKGGKIQLYGNYRALNALTKQISNMPYPLKIHIIGNYGHDTFNYRQ